MVEDESPRQVRRERTLLTTTERLDFRVLHYRCRDASRLTFLGKHQKESLWEVQVGTETVKVQLRVDRSIVGKDEVGIEFNGKQVFPCTKVGTPMQGKTMDILKSDFIWRHPVCGKPKGMGQAKFFEVRQLGPTMDTAAGTWLPATLTEQLPHGKYTATVFTHGADGKERSVCFQRVLATDIREHATKKLLKVPQQTLMMTIPARDPLQKALLSVVESDSPDKGQLITHFFARRSPPGEPGPSKFVLEVSRDRGHVHSQWSVDDLNNFLRGDVMGVHVNDQISPLRHEWCFMAGPFAKHLIDIQKADSKSNNVFILTVDGEVMVESAPEDIDCHDEFWRCHFKLQGERVLVWNVFEVSSAGELLNSKAEVHQKRTYSHDVVVSLNWKDPSHATLTVDGIDFHSLPRHDMHTRVPMNSTPEALRGNFNLHTPIKVVDDPKAAKGGKINGLHETFSRFLNDVTCALQFQCCQRTSHPADGAQLAKPAAAPAPTQK